MSEKATVLAFDKPEKSWNPLGNLRREPTIIPRENNMSDMVKALGLEKSADKYELVDTGKYLMEEDGKTPVLGALPSPAGVLDGNGVMKPGYVDTKIRLVAIRDKETGMIERYGVVDGYAINKSQWQMINGQKLHIYDVEPTGYTFYHTPQEIADAYKASYDRLILAQIAANYVDMTAPGAVAHSLSRIPILEGPNRAPAPVKRGGAEPVAKPAEGVAPEAAGGGKATGATGKTNPNVTTTKTNGNTFIQPNEELSPELAAEAAEVRQRFAKLQAEKAAPAEPGEFTKWKAEQQAKNATKAAPKGGQGAAEAPKIGNTGCFVAGTPTWIAVPQLAVVSGIDGLTTAFGTAPVECAQAMVPIETVALGQRVPSRNPAAKGDEPRHQWDGASAKVIRLEVRHRTGTIVDVQLLRSAEWLERNDWRVGMTVDLRFTEIAVSANALVKSIDEGPEILPGEGAVVTGRFVTREGSDLVRVTFEDGTRLVGTANHPVWSPLEEDWRGLGEFGPREFVKGRAGLVAIVSTEKLPHREVLYNIEVDGESVYEVTALGILVHNNNPLCVELNNLREAAKKGPLSAADAARLKELEAQVAADAAAAAPKPGTLSNVDARKWYHEQLDQIPEKIAPNLSKEQQFRQATELRNQAKRQARDLMADRAGAAELDKTDPIRPAEYYIEKGQGKGYEGDALWDYLIGSSQRSRATVDQKLGLERKSPQAPQPPQKPQGP